MIEYIGITGFKTKKDAETIVDMLKNQTYMFGYLVSEKSLRFEDMGEFRYPSFKSNLEFKELLNFNSKGKRIIKMIHFNSSKPDFHIRLIPFLKEVKPDALQLNINFISYEAIEALRKECPEIDLLFVYNKSIEKKYSLIEIKNVLSNFKYILFDFSGGNGFKIQDSTIAKSKMFKNIKIGYAGGLSGENVKEFLNRNIGDYFIDAESKLLKNESLDYEACRSYIENSK